MCVITYIWFSLVSPFVKLKQTTSRLYIYMNFVKPTKNNGRLFTYDLLSRNIILTSQWTRKFCKKLAQKSPQMKWISLTNFVFVHIPFSAHKISIFIGNFQNKFREIDWFIWDLGCILFKNFLGPLWIFKLLTTIFVLFWF